MTFWVAGAVVVGGALSAYSSNKAVGAQTDAASAANDLQSRQFDLTREDQKALYEQQRNDQLMQIERTRLDNAPSREVGLRALYQLDNASGSGGEYGPDGGYQRQAFSEDPGYQFRLQQGEQGINRAAAARGGFNSGAALKSLARYNSDLASQEYGAYDARQNNAFNQFNINRDFRRNNLASLAGIGQTATRDVNQAGATGTSAIGQAGQNAFGTIAQAGQNYSTNVGQNMIGAGNARASGYVAGANALTNGIGQYMGYTQNQNLLNSIRPPTPNVGSSASYAINDYLTS